MSESLPQHVRTAHAPYNFVPLPERIITQKIEDLPDHDAYQAGRYTGYFEVTLETLTPLYTRAARRANSEDSQPSQFFYLHDENQPVIPGSSLRGMLRSLVEIVTFSKLSRLSDRQLIFRAVADTTSLGEIYRARFQEDRIKAGYLVKNGQDWAIRPAKVDSNQRYFIKFSKEDLKEIQPWPSFSHQKVYISVDGQKVSQNPKEGYELAYLVVSGMMSGKKKHCVVYGPDMQAEPIRIPPELWELYEADRDMTRGIPTRKLEKKGEPLFYLLKSDGSLDFFGSTLMFRLPYDKTLQDFIPEKLRQDKPDEVDFAEAMFGYVRETGQQGTKEKAYAGRIFVTDARLKAGQSDIFEEELTPKILSSPKPTTFQHYLVQKSHKKSDLRHYGSKDTVLRGFKLYWRRKITGIQAVEELPPPPPPPPPHSTQHTRIRPVKAGKCFSFRVYFENLSEVELGALAWVLDLPQDCCHALGMAKPYGMGAVRLTPTLHLSNRQARYKHLFEGESWALGLSPADADINIIGKYKKAFEEAFEEKTQKEKQARRNILLTLLRFYQPDGPFDYMTNEEFRERKVLPTPEQVAGGLTVYQPPRPPKVLPKLGVGSVLRCKVDEISEGYILLKPKQDTFRDYDLSEFGDVDPMEISIAIRKKDLGTTQYQRGADATVVVLDIDHEVPELTCRPATKDERQK